MSEGAAPTGAVHAATSVSGEAELWRGRSMGKYSAELDYCQGISTKDLPFERETGKWNGWKGLAGISEFSETVE